MIRRFRLFLIIRMYTVGYIHRKQHRILQHSQKIHPVPSKSGHNSLQKQKKQRRSGSLLGAASDLLMVEHDSKIDAARSFAVPETFQNRKHSGQVVQSRSGYKFLFKSNQLSRIRIVDIHLIFQNILLRYIQLFRKVFFKKSLLFRSGSHGCKREHLGLTV